MSSKSAATVVLDVSPRTEEVQRESVSRIAALKLPTLANGGLIFTACSAAALRVFCDAQTCCKACCVTVCERSPEEQRQQNRH